MYQVVYYQINDGDISRAIERLSAEVNEYLADGYTLVGGITILETGARRFVSQTLVKFEWK